MHKEFRKIYGLIDKNIKRGTWAKCSVGEGFSAIPLQILCECGLQVINKTGFILVLFIFFVLHN